MARVISFILGISLVVSTGSPAHAVTAAPPAFAGSGEALPSPSGVPTYTGTTPPARFAGFDNGLSSPFGYRSDLISVTFNAAGAADPVLGGRLSPAALELFLAETGLELDEFTAGVNVYVMRLPEGQTRRR